MCVSTKQRSVDGRKIDVCRGKEKKNTKTTAINTTNKTWATRTNCGRTARRRDKWTGPYNEKHHQEQQCQGKYAFHCKIRGEKRRQRRRGQFKKSLRVCCRRHDFGVFRGFTLTNPRQKQQHSYYSERYFHSCRNPRFPRRHRAAIRHRRRQATRLSTKQCKFDPKLYRGVNSLNAR